MKIISWNVNGLRAVVNKGFFKYLSETSPDIFSLQETKLQKEQIPKKILDLKAYYKYWSFAKKKGYSGVCLLSKQKPLNISYGIENDNLDEEGRTIIAEYENFILINCYFPNGQKDENRLQYKLAFYEQTLKKMDSLVRKGKNIIVCGDYNTAHKEIDLKNPQANSKRSGFLPNERAWLDKLIASDYIDTFRYFYPREVKYSWWSYRANARLNNSGWRIDYFFVNQKFISIVKTAFIQDNILGSDHCPIGIELSF